MTVSRGAAGGGADTAGGGAVTAGGGGDAAAGRCVTPTRSEPYQLLKLPDLRHALRPPSPAPEDAPGEDSEPHERQCWQLYQKLKSNGVNVSYDVIKRYWLSVTGAYPQRPSLVS